MWKGIIISYLVILLLIGFAWPTEEGLWGGWVQILTSPSILLSDYLLIGGPQATFVNAAVVGIIGLILLEATRTALSGPTVAAVFTMTGFALFGKTPLNILPIIGGVLLYTLLRKEQLKTYVLVAMFGTALGPLVSQTVYGFGLSWFWGILLGLLTGFCLPPLAPHLLHNHQGLNLYNLGFTAGILGTIALALFKAMGYVIDPVLYWSTEFSDILLLIFSIYFGSLIVIACLFRRDLKTGLQEIWKSSGALVTDFISTAGWPATFFNMGLVGLLGLGYLWLTGSPVNGPSLGGVFTMVGFAAFGKHLRNITPIILGVWLGTLIQAPDATAPGAVLAALFSTTLAPIAGTFGPIAGIVAGFLHLATVFHVGIMHGGMNLYNNGLAGGLVATLMVAVARAFFQKR